MRLFWNSFSRVIFAKAFAASLTLSVCCICFSFEVKAATYYSEKSTSWILNSSWGTVACSNNTNAGTYPGAGDDVTICNGYVPVLPAGTTTIHNLTINIGAAFTIPSGATLIVTGVITNSSTIGGPGTLEINHGTVVSVTLGNTGGTTLNLIVGDGTTTTNVTCAASTASLTNLTVNSLSSINFTGNVSIYGNFLNNGIYTTASNKITLFIGSSVQTISGSSVTSFTNLTMDNQNSTPGDNIQISQNIIVTGQLELWQGCILTNSDTVFANGTVVKIAGTVSWVDGNLTKPVSTGSNVVVTFEIGSTTSTSSYLPYRPIADTIASVTTSGYITGNNSYGSVNHPDILSSTIDPTKDVYTYWTLDMSGGLAFTTSRLQFTYLAADIIGGANPPNFTVESYNQGIWTEWSIAPTFTPTTTMTRTANVVTAMGGFIIGEKITNLPVELLYFTAQAEGTIVSTAWATASEINNDYFNIERSRNANDFECIGQVKGAGNSVSMQSYQFTDLYPQQGVNYYRLKQVDYDGKSSYSGLVLVNFNLSKVSNVVLFPNPASDKVYCTLGLPGQTNATITVTDMKGNEVINSLRVIFNNSDLFSFDMNALAPGIYMIRIVTDDEVLNSKFVKN